MSTNTATQDSDDLEALFDSILAANSAEASPEAVVVAEIHPQARPVTSPASYGNEADSSKVINQIGHMARTLHDTLRELGLNKQIEKAASSIPDARDRLNYVATLTEQAAERVLNATEAAQPLVEKMEVEAHRLSGQWQLLFEKKLDVEQFKGLVTQTQAFLHEVPRHAKATNAYLMEIMMAQDFQDLTGQVIKKITAVTKEMEQQLLALLVENAPVSIKADLNAGLLNGPVINPAGRTDIVSNQDQVDDLLESLGF
jgi:chemotaxis protein CheZ